MPDAEFPMANEGPANPDPTARTIDQLRREIGSLRELIEARLDGNDKAVSAAFSAAKEAVSATQISSATAVAKSESAVAKQMDAIGVLIASTVSGLDGKISDMKDRLTAIEARGIGAKDQKEDSKSIFGYVVGGIGLLVSLITIIGFVLANRLSQG